MRQPTGGWQRSNPMRHPAAKFLLGRSLGVSEGRVPRVRVKGLGP